MELAEKRALVCGASKGIGKATAQALVARGATVYALARNEAALAAMADELGVVPVTADLEDHAALAETIGALLGDGAIHILVHNTGGPPGGPLLEAGLDELQKAFGRHVLSAQLLAKALVPGMAEAGFGRIVNVVSTSVREPIPNLGVSNTIRAAMGGWAKSLSRELPAGVTINNVLPGFTDTDRLVSLREGIAARTGQSTDAVLAGWLAQVPEGRLVQPEETAAAIAFLCSPSAGAIRGVSLAVDGGRMRSI